MSNIFKGPCPCGDFEFMLKCINPSDEIQELIYCPKCGAEIDNSEELELDNDEDFDE